LASLKNQTLPLLRPPHLKYFLCICALQFGTFWVASGITLFLPDIFNQLTLANKEYSRDFRVCDVKKLLNTGNFSIDSYSSVDGVKKFKLLLRKLYN
jgi:hypothetical protein